jgi:hypothetical protein
MDPSAHLRLAGVTRLALAGRGPRDAYLFDPHRLALPCWALALGGRGPALLVTLDRHLDLVPPNDPAGIPDAAAGLRALDEHARWHLDVRNVDHVIAAMEAGLVGDVLALGRARPEGALSASTWTDRRGGVHRIAVAPSVAHVADGFGTPAPSPHAAAAAALLAGEGPVLLDVDLDCFTTPSDADPTTLLPWPGEAIRDYLFPEGAAAFWDAVLPRCVALTLAREPYHVGGVVAAGRLFETAAAVVFEELLGVGTP